MEDRIMKVDTITTKVDKDGTTVTYVLKEVRAPVGPAVQLKITDPSDELGLMRADTFQVCITQKSMQEKIQ